MNMGLDGMISSPSSLYLGYVKIDLNVGSATGLVRRIFFYFET